MNTIIWNNLALIPLTNTVGRFAFIDAADLPLVEKYNFQFDSSKGDILTTRNCKAVRLSKLLTEEDWIDHIDRNPLNNTRVNLRRGNPQKNSWNRTKTKRKGYSKYKGVSFHHTRRTWFAYITKSDIRTFLGTFQTEEDAARAYDKAAKEMFGEFACLNFK